MHAPQRLRRHLGLNEIAQQQRRRQMNGVRTPQRILDAQQVHPVTDILVNGQAV
jgi:hypothetical protein